MDLVGLFRPVLPQAVKIFTARGFADVNSRVELIRELMWAEEEVIPFRFLNDYSHLLAFLSVKN